MATTNTGYARSLSLTVKKFVNGVLQVGYPKTYDGRQAFSIEGQNFDVITNEQFSLMNASDYNTRLYYFNSYVAQQENIQSVTPYITPLSPQPRYWYPQGCPVIDNPA